MTSPGGPVPLQREWLNRTVVGAGLTSALGDFCYETTTVILPGFLAILGIPAAVLGLIEGLADAVASFTKMISGYVADKLGHRKLLVLVGYALTPAGQIAIALATAWPMLLWGESFPGSEKGCAARFATRLSSGNPAARAGRAFGFHRAMDTIGAVVGPLLGVALLGWAQSHHGWNDPIGPFRLVLWLSVIPGFWPSWLSSASSRIRHFPQIPGCDFSGPCAAFRQNSSAISAPSGCLAWVISPTAC
jgi:MFS family permease